MIARWFWREWRSPSLLIVWLALSLAVACVLALGNISDRMEKGLSQQSREFMAGDRALRSSREVPQAWLEEAQKRGLKVGKQLTFATMTFAGDYRSWRTLKRWMISTRCMAICKPIPWPETAGGQRIAGPTPDGTA